MTEQAQEFRQWAILELMGHRRLAGMVSEQQLAGAGFIRIDIPKGDGPLFNADVTQFYSPQAIYCVTPTTEEIARKVANSWASRPLALLVQPEYEGE